METMDYAELGSVTWLRNHVLTLTPLLGVVLLNLNKWNIQYLICWILVMNEYDML